MKQNFTYKGLARLYFIMRVSLVNLMLIIVSSFSVLNARPAIGQTLDNTIVSINSKNVSLKEILREIELQTHFMFVCPVELLESYPNADYLFDGKILREVLSHLTRDRGLSYRVSGYNVILYKERVDAPSKIYVPLVVTGKVTDFDTGAGLAGVSVVIKGTSMGVVSDYEGNYKINANQGDILIFSFVGMNTVEESISNRQVVNVVLKSDVENLHEVVINAGYWDVKARENTGNISRITSSDISKQPTSNPLTSMTGRMPGVYIQQTSGVPGGAVDVQIRGRNSISNGTQPLYIIDGVPFSSQSISHEFLSSIYLASGVSPLNSINPSDIESIEVLKDADATAIYGSRGANGVVLITTKKGKAGRTSFDVNYYHGISKVTKMMDLLNTKEYLSMRKESFANDGISDWLEIPEYDIYWPDVTVWDSVRYTDWQDILIGGTAQTDNIQTSLNGGNENTTYVIGAGYYKESTVFPGDQEYQKGSSHIALSHSTPNKKFIANTSVNFVLEKSNLPFRDYTRLARTLAPNAPNLYNHDGRLNWENSTWDNPLAELEKVYDSKNFNVIGNAVFQYNITKWISLKANVGYNNKTIKELTVFPTSARNPEFSPSSKDSYSLHNRSSVQSWIIEPQVLVNRELGKGFLSAIIGATFQDQTNDLFVIRASGFSSDALIKNTYSATTLTTIGDDYSVYRYSGFFGRVNYVLMERFILNLTGRRDGSSRFGPERRFSNFGAAGLAWIFSEEKWFGDGLGFLNYGKLRLSYGTTGNDQIGNYRYLDTYSSVNSYQGLNGLSPSRLFNPDLAWERNKKFESGLELAFFQQRLNFSMSYFRNRSSNQLINYRLPMVTGFTSIQYNLDAVVQNSGFEFELASVNLQKANVKWSTSFNITIPSNKLVAFPGIESSTYADQYVVGQPLNILKLYKYEGVDPTTGVNTFRDENGDGQISLNDDRKTVVVTGQEFYGGLNNSLEFKRFQLDVFFQFVKQTGQNFWAWGAYPGIQINQPREVLGRWEKEGDVSSIQKFSAGYDAAAGAGNTNLTQSDYSLSDASFIRLKNVSLSYRLPTDKLKGIACRVYMQGQNLLTITKYKGLDPESMNFDKLPPLRTGTLGIQITF